MQKSTGYLGSLHPNCHVNIIGGGISGLIVGYFLQKSNIPFTLFEKESRLGGKLQTSLSEIGVFEHAANAIYSSDLVYEVLEDLELTPILARKNLKKFIWRNGSASSPPLKIRELLSLIPKLFKTTPNQGTETLSVGEFFEPFLGKSLTTDVLAPALTGIYAEDIYKLHLQSVFPLPPSQKESYISYFLRLKKGKKTSKRKPTSISFVGGMNEFIDALRLKLGDNIKVGNQITDLPSGNIVIATDAHDAAALLKIKYPEIAEYLKKINYSKLTLNHSFSKYQLPYLKGAFGMVFKPISSNRKLIGLLRNDQIFPSKTKDSKVYSYSFIIKSNNNNNNILSQLQQDLKQINAAEIKRKEISSETISWQRAIPVYDYQRFQSIKAIRENLGTSEQGLVIHGNYVAGVSLRQIIENANELVSDLAKITS